MRLLLARMGQRGHGIELAAVQCAGNLYGVQIAAAIARNFAMR